MALIGISWCQTYGAVVGIQTQDVGNKTNLLSFSIDDGRTLGPGNGLIGIDVFQFAATRSRSGVSTTVLSPDTAAQIPAGSRAALLDDDVALNTGLLNPGGTQGIPAGTKPLPDSPGFLGMGLNFAQTVFNGPGEDFVVIDFSLSDTAPASFVISGLNGGTGFAATSTGFASFTNTDFEFNSPASPSPGGLLPTQAYTQANPVSSLALLESKDLTPSGAPLSNGIYRAIAVDFSALGVAQGGSVTGLWIESTTLHPVFIAAMAVPEPSSLLLCLMALPCLAFMFRRSWK